MNKKDNLIECLCLGTISLIVAPGKFDVSLKTSLFALEASLVGQIFDLTTANFPGATISRYRSTTETLYCLIIVHH